MGLLSGQSELLETPFPAEGGFVAAPEVAIRAGAGSAAQPLFRLEIVRSLQLHRTLALTIMLGSIVAAAAFILVVHPNMVAVIQANLRPASIALQAILMETLPIVLTGMLLGLAAAILANNLDTRIYTASDVERVLGLAPMAQLPDFDKVARGVADEFILRLASSIDHARLTGEVRNCLFTGVTEKTGVSTVAGRVKLMLEEMGKHPVLADASGTPHPLGFPRGERREYSGDTGTHASSLWQQITNETEEEFALTDTAPLALSAETEALARVADAVIVVIQSGVTERAQLRAVVQALLRVNVRVGFVLNRVELKKADPAFRATVKAIERSLQLQGRRILRRKEHSSSAVAFTREEEPQDTTAVAFRQKMATAQAFERVLNEMAPEEEFPEPEEMLEEEAVESDPRTDEWAFLFASAKPVAAPRLPSLESARQGIELPRLTAEPARMASDERPQDQRVEEWLRTAEEVTPAVSPVIPEPVVRMAAPRLQKKPPMEAAPPPPPPVQAPPMPAWEEPAAAAMAVPAPEVPLSEFRHFAFNQFELREPDRERKEERHAVHPSIPASQPEFSPVAFAQPQAHTPEIPAQELDRMQPFEPVFHSAEDSEPVFHPFEFPAPVSQQAKIHMVEVAPAEAHRRELYSEEALEPVFHHFEYHAPEPVAPEVHEIAVSPVAAHESEVHPVEAVEHLFQHFEYHAPEPVASEVHEIAVSPVAAHEPEVHPAEAVEHLFQHFAYSAPEPVAPEVHEIAVSPVAAHEPEVHPVAAVEHLIHHFESHPLEHAAAEVQESPAAPFEARRLEVHPAEAIEHLFQHFEPRAPEPIHVEVHEAAVASLEAHWPEAESAATPEPVMQDHEFRAPEPILAESHSAETSMAEIPLTPAQLTRLRPGEVPEPVFHPFEFRVQAPPQAEAPAAEMIPEEKPALQVSQPEARPEKTAEAVSPAAAPVWPEPQRTAIRPAEAPTSDWTPFAPPQPDLAPAPAPRREFHLSEFRRQEALAEKLREAAAPPMREETAPAETPVAPVEISWSRLATLYADARPAQNWERVAEQVLPIVHSAPPPRTPELPPSRVAPMQERTPEVARPRVAPVQEWMPESLPMRSAPVQEWRPEMLQGQPAPVQESAGEAALEKRREAFAEWSGEVQDANSSARLDSLRSPVFNTRLKALHRHVEAQQEPPAAPIYADAPPAMRFVPPYDAPPATPPPAAPPVSRPEAPRPAYRPAAAVVAAPEFLPPRPMVEVTAPEPVQTLKPARRERRWDEDLDDDVQILPSRRGQYRRR